MTKTEQSILIRLFGVDRGIMTIKPTLIDGIPGFHPVSKRELAAIQEMLEIGLITIEAGKLGDIVRPAYIPYRADFLGIGD